MTNYVTLKVQGVTRVLVSNTKHVFVSHAGSYCNETNGNAKVSPLR